MKTIPSNEENKIKLRKEKQKKKKKKRGRRMLYLQASERMERTEESS